MIFSPYTVYTDLLSSEICERTGFGRFLVDHPSLEIRKEEEVDLQVYSVETQPWILKFDGSSTESSTRVGIIIVSPLGVKTTLSFNLNFDCTNTQAEYEALVIGLEILQDLRTGNMLIMGDSQLVLKQLSGEFKCTSVSLAPYYTAAIQLLEEFKEISFLHVPRENNWEADELAQIASGLRFSNELTHKLILVQKRHHPSIIERRILTDSFSMDVDLAGDWRTEIEKYLSFPGKKVPYSLKVKALNYVLLEGDLYRKGHDSLLLRCLGFPDAMKIMK